jgi:ribosomal protein S18 acetylase RimI-like enzyme
MDNIIYRKSVKEDIPFINNLFIEMIKTVNKRMEIAGIDPYKELEKGYEEGYLEQFYLDDTKVIFVAEHNNIVVGFISLCKEDGYIYIDDYSVSETYRGKGIGSTLLDMSIDRIKKLGINLIKTHIESANKESREFYKNKGFKLLEEQGHRLLIEKELG